MFIVTFSNGTRLKVSAADPAGARHAAYRVERSQPIASIERCA